MSPFALDPLIEKLAAEFKRLGMPKHLAKLRAFYGARKRRKRAQLAADPTAWDDDMVLGWLCLLQVPPFERAYPTLGTGEPCSCGARSKDGAGAFIIASFPGGHLWRCEACGATWLVRDATTGLDR